jgi:hypothetical protein
MKDTLRIVIWIGVAYIAIEMVALGMYWLSLPPGAPFFR